MNDITTVDALAWFGNRKAAITMSGARAMYDKAIVALRAQQEQENPRPLTLDELREMDGEPVWIVGYPDWGHWELSQDAEDYLEDRDVDFYGMKHDDPDGRYGLHKLGWIAYRDKPKGRPELLKGTKKQRG